jgi:hypothetical protein
MMMTALRLTSHEKREESSREGRMNAMTCGIVSPLLVSDAILKSESRAGGIHSASRITGA